MDWRIGDFSAVLIRQILDWALRRKERHGVELWSGRGAGSAIGVGVLLLADFFAGRRVHQSLCAAPWVTKKIEPACHGWIFGTEACVNVPRRKAALFASVSAPSRTEYGGNDKPLLRVP